jgi:hypothetical protein
MKVQSEINYMLKLLPQISTTAGAYYTDPIILRGWDGTGSPEFSNQRISFNGDKKNELDHETFHFEFNGQPAGEFCFCKTARKPYDFVVCICLLSLANNLEGFEISSDGDLEEWQPAIDFYKKIFGKLNDNVLKFLEE